MTILTIPDWSTMLAAITPWASGPFTEFLLVVYITVGLAGGAMIIVWFANIVINALRYMFERKDDDLA